ncbi:MAG: M20/M25/M40 family metallo-hydrolase [Phycisphaerae bacterium]
MTASPTRPPVCANALAERLTRLVQTPSISRQESAVADLVAGELSQAGLVVQRHLNNVWCEFGDAPRPRMLLNSHLDTVPPAQGWCADPWTPRIIDERLIGLGANDAKGCVAAMMHAALALHAALHGGQKLGGTLVLALTAEEEISGVGLSEILARLGPIDAALVGEPTGLTPRIAQRGLLVLRCTARGRTSHPANTPPDTPNNAIQNACDDLRRMREFDWGPPHPLLGRTHAHVTRIQGGVANNVVPDSCEFLLDIRTTPGETHAALTARLRAHLRSEIAVHSERLVPVSTPEEAAIVRAVLRALPGARPAGSPAMSDMVFLAGIPSVKIGPGQSPRSHTPDEFILLDELSAGAAAYERIAREFFQQDVGKK